MFSPPIRFASWNKLQKKPNFLFHYFSCCQNTSSEGSDAKRSFDEIKADDLHILIQTSQIENVKACLEGKKFWVCVEACLWCPTIFASPNWWTAVSHWRSTVPHWWMQHEKVDRVLNLLLDQEISNNCLSHQLGKQLKESKQWPSKLAKKLFDNWQPMAPFNKFNELTSARVFSWCIPITSVYWWTLLHFSFWR